MSDDIGVFTLRGHKTPDNQFAFVPTIDGPTNAMHVDVCFMLINNKLDDDADFKPESFVSSENKFFHFEVIPTDGLEGFKITKFEHSGFAHEKLTQVLDLAKNQILSRLR